MKLLDFFLVVGTAMFMIASMLSGKGIIACLPKYSSSFLAKKDFSTFTFYFVLFIDVIFKRLITNCYEVINVCSNTF